MEKKAAAINYNEHIHYNDHLIPICSIMGMPLLVVDPMSLLSCEKYYPYPDVSLLDYQDFNPEYLIQRYDAIFLSDLWGKLRLRELFSTYEKKYHKTMRNVHVPHGFSDKGFYIRKAVNEDITLVYGQNMLDQFKAENVLHNLGQYVITGNYRYTYYLRNKSFFDEIIVDEVLSQFDRKRKTILYAPTWNDSEESTTFFAYAKTLLDNLPDDYNMIVKLHPQLESDDSVLYHQIIGAYLEKKNIYFLTEFPLVYPLLNYIDIYIGDMSSIGYDFLIFNKPMFFLNKYERDTYSDRRSYLFRCGIDIKPSKFREIYSIIERNITSDQENFSKVRKEVYDYTFGKERPFEDIKGDIIAAINQD